MVFISSVFSATAPSAGKSPLNLGTDFVPREIQSCWVAAQEYGMADVPAGGVLRGEASPPEPGHRGPTPCWGYFDMGEGLLFCALRKDAILEPMFQPGSSRGL